MSLLSNHISIKRRYTRSINLERDIEIPDSIIGYVPTSRAVDVLERFLEAYSQPHSVRAWTLTGAYGTGKSAFAHFLSSLCSPIGDQNHINALEILGQVDKNKSLQKRVNDLPDAGLVRAVVTAQREPIANTVAKAADRGASIFWGKGRGRRPDVLKELRHLAVQADLGNKIDNRHLISVLKALANASKAGVLVIIDELGKNFEFSAQSQSLDDLYLLQQLAELPSGEQDARIFIIGVLHQSFADYAHGLSATQRNEWAKIQGRFEDIPYTHSSEGVMRLIGHAIDQSNARTILPKIRKCSKDWKPALEECGLVKGISIKDISAVYPLHPFSAMVLPLLCAKFSQNDRTLFTFLSSGEPSSFSAFLAETAVEKHSLPTFKLHRVYDYFVEAAGMSFSIRPQFQRWVEIQSRISDAKSLDQDAVIVMKTIGVLNLVSTTGSLRATRKSVILAVCDKPNVKKETNHWDKTIRSLITKGFLTWRKQLDELRIWEGSDFDIEKAILDQSEMFNMSLADLLNKHFPLKPLVAQRHSYKTGTLRYFERQYFDNPQQIVPIKCKQSDSDGLICCWIGKKSDLGKVPLGTENGKPVIVICASGLNALKMACHEYVALKQIGTNTTQLQLDGVARREVGQRALFAERLLHETLSRCFDVVAHDVICLSQGRKKSFGSQTSFCKHLSDICDEVYDQGLRLWNELVNRRVTTSQGSAARRTLIEAMLQNAGQKRLGITGNGPEYSLFESLLRETGIYRKQGGNWCFSPPSKESGVYKAWKAIERFCMSATDSPVEITSLYNELEAPPHGVKKGIIPILLLTVLLYHDDSISVYMNGTFIPILGIEHFELFFRKPERFAVKYFRMSGLRAKIFKELEGVLSANAAREAQGNVRNRTILSIVKPLVAFAGRLPQFTQKTEERVSSEAKAVRTALLKAKDPDDLIFRDLPIACGYPFLTIDKTNNNKNVRAFRAKLVHALKELHSAYDALLSESKNLVYKALAVRSDKKKFREDLRVRATYLSGQVIEQRLRRFILALTNEDEETRIWLETLLMTIADKPPRVWTDTDVIIFETKLGDLARRFRHVEAIQREFARDVGKGFDVRRVTVTKPDGSETNRIVWIDREERHKIDKIAKSILRDNGEIKEAVAAVLIERVFAGGGEMTTSPVEIKPKEADRG